MFVKIRLSTVILLVIFFFTGCSSNTYVRHLASDACLITPQQSSKKDVMEYMGPPDNRRTDSAGEQWIYYQRHQSFLRKTPYVGEKIGSEDYEAMIVTFTGDIVKTCVYHTYSEQEFKDAKLRKPISQSKSVEEK